MEVGQHQVDAAARGQRLAQPPDAGAGVQHERGIFLDSNFDGRSVAAVGNGVGAGGRQRTPSPPQRHPHNSALSQNIATTPWRRPMASTGNAVTWM